MRPPRHSSGDLRCGKRHLRLTSATLSMSLALVWMFCCPMTSLAHPLGNFTINHFTRIEVGSQQIKLRYVVDMAEIPTFQELQTITGQAENAPSESELAAYTERVAAGYAERLILTLDGSRIPLSGISKQLKMLPGAGGMQTLRIECELAGLIPAGSSATPHRVLFEDNNYQDRIGWREIVVAPVSGLSVFTSSAFANSISNE